MSKRDHAQRRYCTERCVGHAKKLYNVITEEKKNNVISYRVTRRVFSKSVTSKLNLLFQKILAGSLKTLKVTRISAMYTNISHPPVHSGPSKFSRPKI